jgi:hypothetical protein
VRCRVVAVPCSRYRKWLGSGGAARTRPLVAGRRPTRYGPSGRTTASPLTSLLTPLAQPVPRVRNLEKSHAPYDLLSVNDCTPRMRSAQRLDSEFDETKDPGPLATPAHLGPPLACV